MLVREGYRSEPAGGAGVTGQRDQTVGQLCFDAKCAALLDGGDGREELGDTIANLGQVRLLNPGLRTDDMLGQQRGRAAEQSVDPVGDRTHIIETAIEFDTRAGHSVSPRQSSGDSTLPADRDVEHESERAEPEGARRCRELL
jgi:hypothetical protein